MSEEKRRWGIYGINSGWHCHEDGEPMLSINRQDAEGLHAALQPQRSELLYVLGVPAPDVQKKKTLWGLWVSDGGKGNRWYLDYFGRPCFSYDRRLVAAHADARKSSEIWIFSVRKVGDDGRPTDGLLEPAADSLASLDQGSHLGCTEIDELQSKDAPEPNGIDCIGAGQVAGDDGYSVEPAVGGLAQALADRENAMEPHLCALSSTVVEAMARKEDAEWQKLSDDGPREAGDDGHPIGEQPLDQVAESVV